MQRALAANLALNSGKMLGMTLRLLSLIQYATLAASWLLAGSALAQAGAACDPQSADTASTNACAVQRFQQDGVAIGTGEQAIPADVCSFQAIVPKETDWRDFAASPVWLEQVADPEAEKQYQV